MTQDTKNIEANEESCLYLVQSIEIELGLNMRVLTYFKMPN